MIEIKEFIREEIKSIVFYNIEDDESIVKSKLLDSITVVDLIVSIEEKTGIHIPTIEATENNFDTINKIVAYLDTKK